MNNWYNNHRVFGFLAIILLTAFAVRTAAAVYWESRFASGGFYYGDSDGYWQLGKCIASGQAYQYEQRQIFRSPGYPAFLALLMRVFGLNVPIFYARLAGAFIGTISVWLVWKIGSQVQNSTVGLIAAAIAAIHPELVMISPMILSEGLFCLLILLQFCCFYRYFESQEENTPSSYKINVYSVFGAILVGICTGLACLVKPGWILFTPAALFCWIVYKRFIRKELSLKYSSAVSMIILVSTFLTIFPWMYRNHAISGRWIAGTLQRGPSLLDGLNPLADGGSNMALSDSIFNRINKDGAQHSPIEREIEVDRITRDEAIQWAVDNPNRVFHLAIQKFCRTWSPVPNQKAFSKLPIQLIFSGSYLFLLVFSLYYIYCSGKKSDFWLLCILIILYFSGLHCIFVGSLRYRLPAIWLLSVLASQGIYKFISPPVFPVK